MWVIQKQTFAICGFKALAGLPVTQPTVYKHGVDMHHEWLNSFLAAYWHIITHSHTHTHTHPFNNPFSGTTRVSRYQKGKTNLDFTEARESEWQWHQLGHMQVCISLQTNNHSSTPPLKFFTGRMPFLPPNQQHQSTEGTIGTSSVVWLSWMDNRHKVWIRYHLLIANISNMLHTTVRKSC